MRVLRSGLFVTLYHVDAVFRHDLQIITGYELSEFERLMWDIDELSGHNDESRLLLETQVRELAALTATELDERSRRVRDVVDAAEKYGVNVPLNIRAAGDPPG
jgi:hypothetical protein